MATLDRWPKEMQDLQEAIVWLVPDAESARNLVSEAQIPPSFIDFGEPVYMRIKRILIEAEKREMMPALLSVITSWYEENIALAEAKLAWEVGQDRKAAARLLRKAAKDIPDPIAVAKIRRKGDRITDVEVDVEIPHLEDEMTTNAGDVETVLEIPFAERSQSDMAPAKRKATGNPLGALEEMETEIPYSDTIEPGDWFSVQKTLADQERRIVELETWRRQLSIMPTPEARHA